MTTKTITARVGTALNAKNDELTGKDFLGGDLIQLLLQPFTPIRCEVDGRCRVHLAWFLCHLFGC